MSSFDRDRDSASDIEKEPEGPSEVFDEKLMAQWRPIIQAVAELRALNLSESVKNCFPSVCIIGAQSSGKSSLVETIIGLECLPKGEGTVTKRPTELYITNDPDFPIPQFSVADKIGAQEKICKSKEEFQSLIVKMNSRTDDIIPDPIIAKVRWSKGFDFTITDLPGIIAISDKGNDKVGKITQEITKNYILKENVIIVCVLPAHTDETVSEAFRLVKQVDKDFERTIFVRTKGDLLLNDPGRYIESALKISGRFNKRAFLTINRSNKDNEKKLSIRQCFENEKKVKDLDPEELRNRYPLLLSDDKLRSEIKTYSEQIGIDKLLKSIINIFSMKMRANQPEVMRRLLMQKDEFGNKLKALPPAIDDKNKGRLFAQYCDELYEEFGRLCSGNTISYYMAIEPFIRQKSGQKYNDEKVFLASKVNANIVDMLLLYFEASGMQSRQEFVAEPFLKKCIYQILVASKKLTDQMFMDVHKHILDVIADLIRRSRFNREIQSKLTQDMGSEIDRFRELTKDVIERIFSAETTYPFWEPDHYDLMKEEPNMRFTYRKEDSGMEEACILSKTAFMSKYQTNLGSEIKDENSTLQLGSAVMDNVKVPKEDEIYQEYEQAKLRKHLFSEFERRRMENPQIEFYFANRIIQPLLEKVEANLEQILDICLKGFAYCYFVISQRKNFVASLLCKDYLEKIKQHFFKIVHNEEYIKFMGEEPEVRDLRNTLQDRLDGVQMAIDKVSKAFNLVGMHQLLAE